MDRLVRLRAEMKLPGEAWLQWTIEPDGSGSTLHQRAIFYPRGLLGRAYWYVLVPFHGIIFERMCTKIAHAAARRATGEPAAAAVVQAPAS